MFRLSDKAEDTFVAGLSMGGLGAMLTGLRYPQTFSRIGSFSGAFVFDQYPEDDAPEKVIQKRSFIETIAGPEPQYKGGRNDCLGLAEKLKGKAVPLPKLFMAVGTQDPLAPVTRKMRDGLLELQYDVSYLEREGSHSWDFWDTAIESFLEWLPLEEKTLGLSSGHIG